MTQSFHVSFSILFSILQQDDITLFSRMKTIQMVSIALNDCNPFTSIKTANYNSNQTRSCNCCQFRLQHNQHFNESSSNPLTCNAACNETADQSLSFCSFLAAPCLFLYMFVQYFILKSILKIILLTHDFECKFTCMSHQFPIKFNSIRLSTF